MDLDSSYEYTNAPGHEVKLIEPYADEKNVEVFKRLQKLESVGIIEPFNAKHMYFAAMNATGCKLTELGKASSSCPWSRGISYHLSLQARTHREGTKGSRGKTASNCYGCK